MKLADLKTKVLVMRGMRERIAERRPTLVSESRDSAHAAVTLHGHVKKLEQLFKHADADLEGKAIPDLETLAIVKRYVKRATEITTLEGLQRDNEAAEKRGRMAELDDELVIFDKEIAKSADQLERIELAIQGGMAVLDEDGHVELVEQTDHPLDEKPGASVTPIDAGRRPARPPGVRPGPSIKQQRMAEDAAAKAAAAPAPAPAPADGVVVLDEAQAPDTEEPAVAPDAEVPVVSEKKPAKSRSRRSAKK